MPRKKDGLPYEVHPTPAKGKDGRNIVYVRPASGMKVDMKELETFCRRNGYGLREGELSLVLLYHLLANTSSRPLNKLQNKSIFSCSDRFCIALEAEGTGLTGSPSLFLSSAFSASNSLMRPSSRSRSIYHS